MNKLLEVYQFWSFEVKGKSLLLKEAIFFFFFFFSV